MLVSKIIRFAIARAWAICIFCLAGTILLGTYAIQTIGINTDVNKLLADDLPWRQREAALEKAFPQYVDTLVIIVDGKTPDGAEQAATLLYNKLKSRTDLFTMVVRPDQIPFFRKNGLMFLDAPAISAMLDKMIEGQPLLGTVAADPSLRGYLSTINLMATGVAAGATDVASIEPIIKATSSTVTAALDGKDAPLPLQSLMGPDTKPALRDLRKIILTKPVLDYTALQPGERASKAIRNYAAELHLSDMGARVRLTGSVPLGDEELASVAEGTGYATILSALLVLVILFMAMRSFRLVLPILLTLTTGLAATTAFAVAAFHTLNMISVAFAVMFIGIAVDFGIQFGIRYRDHRWHTDDYKHAMDGTAKSIALPLSMAAASTALGFLAFIPTDYRGVSELGAIAGVGMVIAFILNITLLPALLTLFKPPAEKEAVGYQSLIVVDAFLLRNRTLLLTLFAIIGLGSITVASHVRFDFDPLNLKNPGTESVSTLLDAMQDPDFGVYTVNILRPTLDDAKKLAAALDKLPEVDHTLTLSSFVPDEQDKKLPLIQDAAMLLAPTLAMTAAPAPTKDQILQSIKGTATSLHTIEGKSAEVARLANMLGQIAQKADDALLGRLDQNIVGVLQTRLQSVRDILGAEPVTEQTISGDLRRDWVTADGQYRIEVYPKGNPRDYRTLQSFTHAVQSVAPDAGGAPISIQESAATVSLAFLQAALYALFAIGLLSFLILRRVGDVIRLMLPLILAGSLTLGTMVVMGLPLNFANIIALPLLLSLGVSYTIYVVAYWRAGHENPLTSSMARAVLFSAATTTTAFGSLMLSTHPGTAGMGKLLTVAMLYCLICTFLFLPVLLGKPKDDNK